MDGNRESDFSFFTSSSLQIPFFVRISSIEGSPRPPPLSELLQNPSERNIASNTNPISEVYASVQLWANSKPLTAPVRTSYKSFKKDRAWKEWLTLPIKYSDLPLTSQIAITIWDSAGPRKQVPFGGTTFHVFNTTLPRTLRTGPHKLKLWLGREADGLSETSTPGTFTSTSEMDRLEKLFKRLEQGDLPRVDWLDNIAYRKSEQVNTSIKSTGQSSEDAFIYIDYPRFDFPIVFSEPDYPPPPFGLLHASTPHLYAKGAIEDGEGGPVCMVWDPEAIRDNPVEAKHRRLVRSHRNGPLEKELKPNPKIRDEINAILNYAPTQELTREEKDLLWNFRFHLTRDKRACTKFLKCVIWSDATEVKQALELLPQWEVDVDDALELLGPAFKNREVRAYAVKRLRKADDDELLLYLLQLVQALKYEKITDTTDPAQDSSLANFLIERSIQNPILGNNFHWYLMVEGDDEMSRDRTKFIHVGLKFKKAMHEQADGKERLEIVNRQAELARTLRDISREIRNMRGDRNRKIERLKQAIKDNQLESWPPLPFFLDASVKGVELIEDDASVFKSSLSPLRLTFKTDRASEYPVIFKSGDDLRQDQLVIQTVLLMDKLLLKENLDLKLTPYHIIALGIDHGAVQFIDSVSLGVAMDKGGGSIVGYLRTNNPSSSNEPFGVKKEAMETYIRSCAGYCVVTYLLGVGDRHLDNLLLTRDGRFFHADFGFILGRDPKPFAPQMKLSKEMVDGMGGATSEYYKQFRSFCFTAYTTLRKSANLILNLFALMVDANIPDILLEPDKAVLKVKEKFCLEMSEEEAIKHFSNLIDGSQGAFMPWFIDITHGLLQNMRS